MFLHRSFRSAILFGGLALLLGCGRQSSRSVAPLEGLEDGAAPLRVNGPPAATILDPAPSAVFFPTVEAPLTITWTGQDPDGHVREYRYRLFEESNPDFTGQTDFVQFLTQMPDSVLSFYAARDFAGWESIKVKPGGERVSVTYPSLIPNKRYALAVVAIDNRGDHDAHLTLSSNVLVFFVRAPIPDLTYFGPFGSVTNPPNGDRLVVPAGQPATVHWRATPKPGMVIRGYVSGVDSPGLTQPSLDDTIRTIEPPISGDTRLLWVDTEFDLPGLPGLHTLGFIALSFTGTGAGSVRAKAALAIPALSRKDRE
jgi:hypothetical protein